MEKISFFYLFQVILRYLYLIIAAVIIFALGAFFYSNYVAVARYSATGSLLVTNGAITDLGDSSSSNSNSKKVAGADIAASLDLKPTIVKILTENGLYKKLAEKTEGRYSYGRLRNSTRVTAGDETVLYVDVTFTSTSPSEAQRLVNELLTLAPEYIEAKIPNTKTSITEADYAVKTYPNTFSNIVTSAFLGALVALMPILLIAFFNNTIRTENDLMENYDIPIIGNIPDFANAKSGKGYNYKYNYYQKGGYGYYGRR